MFERITKELEYGDYKVTIQMPTLEYKELLRHIFSIREEAKTIEEKNEVNGLLVDVFHSVITKVVFNGETKTEFTKEDIENFTVILGMEKGRDLVIEILTLGVIDEEGKKK